MARLKRSSKKFVIIYVKFFRHYRTKRLVFPKPPNKCIKLKIPIAKWRAYQKRKAVTKNAA